MILGFVAWGSGASAVIENQSGQSLILESSFPLGAYADRGVV